MLISDHSRTAPNPDSAVPAIVIDHVSYSYGEHKALDDVSFSVAAGEIVGVLGPNGGGKTTLFRLLSTLSIPQEGRVAVFGADAKTDRLVIRRHLGVVFQDPALDNQLTVSENLIHHGHLHGITGEMLRERIRHCLTRLEVSDRCDTRVAKLSGGLKRRVELARALITDPLLLLMDEPTSGLDPLARESFWRLVHDLRDARGLTVLYTTHFLDEAESADRLAILDRGRLVALDPPSVLCDEIDGHIVTIECDDPSAVAQRLAGELNCQPAIGDRCVRITTESDSATITSAMRLLGDEVASISVSRPTLADVFRLRAGRDFAHSDIHSQSVQEAK